MSNDGRMTPEEARLTQLGAAFLAAYLRGDWEGTNNTSEEFEPLSRLADGLIYLAIATGELLALHRGLSLELVLQSTAPSDQIVVPEASMNVEAAIELALGVKFGDEARISEAQANFDVPSAINSAFALALGLNEELSNTVSKPALELAEIWATGAALNPPRPDA